MMLLVCFDLPRETKEERRIASKYRERLIEMRFMMKQYSLYERYVSNKDRRDKLISILKQELPSKGAITLYILPDEVNRKQITILGTEAKNKYFKQPRLIFI